MPIYSDDNRSGVSTKSDDFMYAVESSLSPSPQLSSLQLPMGAGSSMDPDEDVYSLLAQKERDLLLAAEIGQALLEKNDELSKQNEKIAEDFSKKLEVRHQYTFFLVTLEYNSSGANPILQLRTTILSWPSRPNL